MNRFAFLIIAIFISPSAFAADTYENITVLGKFFLAVSFMVGLFMFIGSLYSFYLSGKYGNDPSRSVGSAFAKMAAGVFLLLPTTLYGIVQGTVGPDWTMTNESLALSSTVLETVGSTGFLGYLPESTTKSLMGMIWLIGLFGFLKGLYLVRFAAEQANGSQGYSPVKKILMHMIGGAMLMNIRDVSHLVGSFFGWDFMMI